MNIGNKISIYKILTGAMVLLAISINTLAAHSFNTTLIVAGSDLNSRQNRAIRNGFMLATEENDGHADQESDGHLGGLDVYVTVVTEQSGTDKIGSTLARTDILVFFASSATRPLIDRTLKAGDAVLLLPGQSPFAAKDELAVAAFITAYNSRYGTEPGDAAARGYNAARRIDAAVRAQSGADDRGELQNALAKTAKDFDW